MFLVHGGQYIITTKRLTELKGVNQMEFDNRCSGCIMIKYKCIMIYTAKPYIEDCPCLKCLVKITCDFDTVCDKYDSYMKILNADEKYKERIKNYELRYNATL